MDSIHNHFFVHSLHPQCLLSTLTVKCFRWGTSMCAKKTITCNWLSSELTPWSINKYKIYTIILPTARLNRNFYSQHTYTYIRCKKSMLWFRCVAYRWYCGCCDWFLMMVLNIWYNLLCWPLDKQLDIISLDDRKTNDHS